MKKPGKWSKIANGTYRWLEQHELCPCILSFKLLRLFRLEQSTGKFACKFARLGMLACGWIVLKLPLTLEEYDMIVLQSKLKDANKEASKIEFVESASQVKAPNSAKLWN